MLTSLLQFCFSRGSSHWSRCYLLGQDYGHEFFNGVSTLAQQEARAAKSATAGATEDDADCSRAAKRRRVESVADKGDPDDLCDAGATEDAAESVQEEAAATLSSDRTTAFAQRFKVFDVDKVKMHHFIDAEVEFGN